MDGHNVIAGSLNRLSVIPNTRQIVMNNLGGDWDNHGWNNWDDSNEPWENWGDGPVWENWVNVAPMT